MRVKLSHYGGKELAHLPQSEAEALLFAERTQTCIQRAEEGFYKDRLIITTAVERSANTTIADCIALIQANLGPDRKRPNSTYGIRSQAPWVKGLDQHDLRPDLLVHKMDGGVVNRVFHPLPWNLYFLEWLQIKYFIVLRHPADQLAAMYGYLPERMTERWAANPILTLPWKLYESTANEEMVIGHFINEGFLLSLLKYMGDWLSLRSSAASMILRFEDFADDKRLFFEGISQFLYGESISETFFNEVNQLATDSQAQRRLSGKETRRYTQGPADRTEIWRSYFSDENLRDYRNMVEHVLAAYPPARRILEIYPDLIPH